MAETLLSFGVEKLWNLLDRESKRFQGVEDQFDELKSELETLRCFVEDADSQKHSSATLKNTVKEIKEIVYDAEDIIETFLLKDELGKTNGIRKRIRKLVCVIADRRGLAFDMEALSKRIAKVIRNMTILGVQQVNVNERDTQSLQERQREKRQTFSSDNEENPVGLEKNVEQLVGYLVEEASNQVVSIIGMGGIGKTTLARQVFHHEMVQNHFDGVAWVCISQQFTTKDVWQTIFKKLSSKHDEQKNSNMTEQELQEELFGLLETSNSLIVLDDMWKEEDWDRIKSVFPSKKGWKVLLTSRNENVALHADPTCVIFKPECLTPEESWTLFQRIAFPSKDTAEFKVDVEEMEDMGKQMIKDCGGLPLAVRVLGGLLAAQHTLSAWKRVYENIGSCIVGGTTHILSLSFEELPIYLKQCFLYLAHFPEDFSIDVGNLAYYWAAERIPRPRYYDGATIREVADGYVEELVKRNMVISKRAATTSRFETCQLHDMMREVCLLKAEEENFVHIVDKSASTATSQSPCKPRRIAVHQLDETYHPKWEMQNPKLRSFLFIIDEFRLEWMASGLSFTRVQLMRVLDLSYAKFEGGKLPSSIGKLIHLRYLSLYLAEITHLPSSMRNLKLLLYLNLRVYEESEAAPLYMPTNFLKEMRELTYLYLPEYIHNKVKLELGNLVNLETLENFSTEHSSVRDLHRMTRLETLSIIFNGKGCTMDTLSSSLSELRHLEDLNVYGKGVVYTKDEEGFVLDCGSHLKQLRLTIYMPKLPDEQHFPSRLTFLDLKGCCLVEDPMPILEKLLHLKGVHYGNRSFAGRRMVCSGGGFLQLQELAIRGLEEWEDLIVEEGSMPLLHYLLIDNCPKLKRLPVGGFPQLQELRLFELHDWEEWIVKEGSMPLLHTLRINNCPKLKRLPVGGLPQLQELSIRGLEEWEEWIVEEGSMPLLHTLNIENCPKLKRLPVGGFSQLHRLYLRGLDDLEEWIVEEGSMPLLHTLRIENCPKLKRLPVGGFTQLQKLYLGGLDDLEEWIVEEGSMPLLHTLTMWNCPKLKELPDGLQFIYSLKKLRMGVEWKEKLFEGGEEYYKVQHIPLVQFYSEEDMLYWI